MKPAALLGGSRRTTGGTATGTGTEERGGRTSWILLTAVPARQDSATVAEFQEGVVHLEEPLPPSDVDGRDCLLAC